MTLLGVVVAIVVVVGGLIVAESSAMRRRGTATAGTRDVVVRCAQGHLFTTIWIPGVSLKAMRWGARRYQWCPVGRHWSVVSAQVLSGLSDAQRDEAARVHDLRVP